MNIEPPILIHNNSNFNKYASHKDGALGNPYVIKTASFNHFYTGNETYENDIINRDMIYACNCPI
ncbi:MAG: hypothetical protein ACTSRP_22425 [Candidatus Helarchaeota archaeon]